LLFLRLRITLYATDRQLLYDRFFEGNMMDWGNSNFADSNSTLPAVHVKEYDDEFQIEVAAPGLTILYHP